MFQLRKPETARMILPSLLTEEPRQERGLVLAWLRVNAAPVTFHPFLPHLWVLFGHCYELM